jgi:GTP-binding protein Era
LTKAGGAHRAGFAAIVGRPNVGKSTLLNKLVQQKLAIVSPKPQTTRSRILGVVTQPGAQIAFVDTPGLHEARSGLNARMVDRALRTVADADVVLFLIEAGPPRIHPKVKDALERVKQAKKPTVLVINKIDLLSRDELLPLIDRFSKEHDFADIYPLSALTGENLEGLLDVLVPLLPEGDPLFPADVWTDVAERDLCAELVREQILRQTEQEVPYSAAVVVEEFDESERQVGPRGLVRLLATILVERDSQKGILIGKGGARLKEIGARSRAQMEKLLGCKVFLQLHVRVEKDWTQTEKGLRRAGYSTED